MTEVQLTTERPPQPNSDFGRETLRLFDQQKVRNAFNPVEQQLQEDAVEQGRAFINNDDLMQQLSTRLTEHFLSFLEFKGISLEEYTDMRSSDRSDLITHFKDGIPGNVYTGAPGFESAGDVVWNFVGEQAGFDFFYQFGSVEFSVDLQTGETKIVLSEEGTKQNVSNTIDDLAASALKAIWEVVKTETRQGVPADLERLGPVVSQRIIELFEANVSYAGETAQSPEPVSSVPRESLPLSLASGSFVWCEGVQNKAQLEFGPPPSQ